jgi:transposase
MYRVDVTLDEPVRSSVLCGPCGHVELVAGGKPSSYSCPSCKMLLWDEEE